MPGDVISKQNDCYFKIVDAKKEMNSQNFKINTQIRHAEKEIRILNREEKFGPSGRDMPDRYQ